ncbi:MAG: MATE family efflux transporter [Alphaproteobacteria bacterium]|nr:MATE family efflux transporter [Alphaproteobacteria bacterium]
MFYFSNNKDSLKEISLLSFPIALDLLFLFLIFFLDSWFLSYISDDIAGSIGSLFSIFGICAVIFRAISQAGTVLASKYMGMNEINKSRAVVSISISINLLFGLLLSALAIIFSKKIGLWLGLNEEQNIYTTIYLQIVGASLVFLCLRYALASRLYISKNSISNMVITIIMLVSSTIFNILAILFLKGNINMLIGISLGTMLSQILSVICLLYFVKKEDNSFYKLFSIKLLLCNFITFYKKLFSILLPVTAEPIVTQFINIAFTIIAINISALALTARVYVTNLQFIILAFSLAFSIGAQILISNYFGAKQIEKIKKSFFNSIFLLILITLLLSLPVFILKENLFNIFTNNGDIKLLGLQVIYICLLIEFIKILGLMSTFSLVGIGDSVYPNICSILLMCFITLPLSIFFVFYLKAGLIGIFVAQLIEESLRASILFHRFILKIKRMGELHLH